MGVPKIIQDIRGLKSLTGISNNNLAEFVDEQGNFNLETLQSIKDLRDYVDTLYAKLGSNIVTDNIDSFGIGDTFYILESGIPTPFIVVQKNYNSDNNIIAVRKYALAYRQFNGYPFLYDYDLSDIDDYLRNIYKATLTGITFTTISISTISAGATTSRSISREIFLPSYTELTGLSHPRYVNTPEGSGLTYFLDNPAERVCYTSAHDTQKTHIMLRSIYDYQNFYFYRTEGVAGYTEIRTNMHVRPLISIGKENTVYRINSSTNNILATATISE